MSVALVTGASRGLGLALSRTLADRGWALVVDARGEERLHAAAAELSLHTTVAAIAGDVADATHRKELVTAAADLGGLDLLVNNASALGPSPQPTVADYPLDELERVYQVNVIAPVALAQLALPLLSRDRGVVVNVSSDAAVEPYPGWGGYGSAKAALDQLTAILGAEQPSLRIYGFDPGDMRTQLQQEAFPGEDISDRADPESVVPALLRLIEGDRPSGRYHVSELTGAAAS